MIKLPDETEMKWRDLALQFDAHRMQAISLLKMIIKDVPDDQYLLARNFIESAPLPGEEVLRNRIAEIAEVQRLNATAQPVSDAANDVLAERQRQQMVEGWTAKHDDQYLFNELAIAGGLYALNAHDSSPAHFKSPPSHWPWNAEWWKPKSPRKDLVRAAALIIAEIERIDRLAAAPGGQDD
ncbi:hypothetical protein [Pantoea ananatis]|uniref:hypothetical protein n=1 Tax=Pantoea ananas TaxID=553 RepID=UPI001FF0817C|nr:hypothetical protein [Pantoea ananatis]